MLNIRKYLAELIGTFVLVAFGCGVAIVSGANLVATSLAFGLVIVAMAYSIGNISGCHINPAVSLAMLINKKLSVTDFCGYVVSQILGAFLGAAFLRVIFGADNGYGANAAQELLTNQNNTALLALIAEIVLTCVFVLAILGVTSRANNSSVAGIVIGLTLVLVHLLGIKLTGTSVNPARSLAPAIFAGGEALKQVWIFIVGPFVGAALAAVAYKFLDKGEKN